LVVTHKYIIKIIYSVALSITIIRAL
jgi:hypothetical protein